MMREVGDQHAEDRRPELPQLRLGRRASARRAADGGSSRSDGRPARPRAVAPGERLLDLGEDAAQVGEHVRVLRAFAGEEQGDRALRRERLLEEVDAGGVADLPALGVGEPVGGAAKLGDQIGAADRRRPPSRAAAGCSSAARRRARGRRA